MTPRLEHWRCDVCRERGSVPRARSAAVLLQRILAQHYELSPECDLAPRPPTVAVGHDRGAWVLHRPQSEEEKHETPRVTASGTVA